MQKIPVLLIATTSLVASLILSSCKSEHHSPAPAKTLANQDVRTVQAQLEPVRNQIELLGTIEAVNRVEIAAKVSGNIMQLPVVLGSPVKKGDLLVSISAGEIDAKLDQSKAQLEKARRNLERERKLLAQKAATRETVRSLEESVSIANAAYQEALTFKRYTEIKAPIDGRVTRKHVQVGDLATPGKPLINIEDSSRLQVTTDIPERFISRVRQGDRLSIEVPSAGMTIDGIVAEVAPTANPMTRTAPVKLDIESHPELHGGQFVRVTLASKAAQTLTVPGNALVPIGQMERLFVVEDGQAQLRLVRSGERYGDRVEILSGLARGEHVVTEGQQSLQDGQPVTIR